MAVALFEESDKDLSMKNALILVQIMMFLNPISQAWARPATNSLEDLAHSSLKFIADEQVRVAGDSTFRENGPRIFTPVRFPP